MGELLVALGSGFKEGQGGSCGDSFMKAVLLMDDAGGRQFHYQAAIDFFTTNTNVTNAYILQQKNSYS